MNKSLCILVVSLFIGSMLPSFAAQDSDILTLSDSILLDSFEIRTLDSGDISVELHGCDQTVSIPGHPMLPLVIKTYTFPVSTIIQNVSYAVEKTTTIQLPGKIECYSEPQEMNLGSSNTITAKNATIYQQETPYPEEQFNYRLGRGIQNDEPVIFLSLYYCPTLYTPSEDQILLTQEVSFTIDYSYPFSSKDPVDIYDLLIITTEYYEEAVTPLLAHKNSVGVATECVTIEEILSNPIAGRDDAEIVKYFIKHEHETLGIDNVLLIGDIAKIPIRKSSPKIMNFHIHQVLSDLYYQDLYNYNGSFSSWDTNSDDVFSESGVDEVDLYPDIKVGRLDCWNIQEVQTVVQKIITYETETYGSDWYHNMIFIGGDTFPNIFSPGNEGEEHNELVMDIMSDFNASAVIWTSKGNFNIKTITTAINEGAGFVDYSGHGFEHGMGTYVPKLSILRAYLSPQIYTLENAERLPVIFFDACLTSKLDFTFEDLVDYDGYGFLRPLALSSNLTLDKALQCYAWLYVRQPTGGAIATIGATRTAFGGTTFGCEKLSTDFFGSYEEGITLGDMYLNAQNTYINDLPNDEFTIEEFIILGDPTLKLGGYQDALPPQDTVESPSIAIQNPSQGYLHVNGAIKIPTPIHLFFLADSLNIGRFQTTVLINADDLQDQTSLNVTLQINNQQPHSCTYDAQLDQYTTTIELSRFHYHTLTATVTDSDHNQATHIISILNL